MSANPKLTQLTCGSNRLTSLDVSGNPALTNLDCDANTPADLELSRNPALRHLNCFHNALTRPDAGANTDLEELNCARNKLDVDALNALFDSLHGTPTEKMTREYSRVGIKRLYVANNPGAEGCDTLVVVNEKGWTVRRSE